MIQTEPHHLRMGTRLNNRYLIQGVLGEGGFGITYVGMDEVLCQKVAVKEFFPRGAITRNNQRISIRERRSSFRRPGRLHSLTM